MIERYALYDIDKLRDHFGLKDGVPKGVKKRYNIIPAQHVPVVLSRGSVSTMELMQWGFVSQGAKDTNSIFRYKTFAVRSEDVFKKTMWEKSIRSQRCLVPANGFYAWPQTPNGKVPHYIQATASPLIALAGIYSSWTDGDGNETGMVSIVTTPADHKTRQYTDRVPVIVPSEQQETWLDPSIHDATSLYDIMRTTPYDSLSIIHVGEGIFSKKLDTADLIHEV